MDLKDLKYGTNNRTKNNELLTRVLRQAVIARNDIAETKVAYFKTTVPFYGATVAFYSAPVLTIMRPLPFMTHLKQTMTQQ